MASRKALAASACFRAAASAAPRAMAAPAASDFSRRRLRSAPSSSFSSSSAEAVPIQRSATCSVAGSMTRKVGQASMGNRSTNAKLLGFSVSMSSQANCPASFSRRASVRTLARMKRQVGHQGAQTSTTSGTFRARASARARA